ncbi:hypothetical protein KFZ56_15365 [Virgibacillus sp. NKC19-3]|uniref:glycoside hydrolase family 18 protein n=1 Tax=Virgibacillus saliphilus TaxID=2831674 RepID=UPI001C9B1292|nr:glycoside hydrolase family 18 protein [Virgibacillus sp. NKC19-3]MBY7144402.1 hypothetical protein [Virgibacillus sp. NKC19-3]
MKFNSFVNLRSVFMFVFLLVMIFVFSGESEKIYAKNSTNQVQEAIQDMKTLVTHYQDDNDIISKEATHNLQIHLEALAHFEGNEETEKSIKHLKNLKRLVNYQYENDLISEKAYHVLDSNTEHLIQTKQNKKDPIIMGYWNGDKKIENFPANKLTHINYAFAYIDEEGNVHPDSSYKEAENDFKELNKYKEKNPHIKSSISIGGWGPNSKYFSDVASSKKSREEFAQATIDKFIIKYNFDGIDLDWEFPVEGGTDELHYDPNDKENLTLLAKEFRDQLDQLEKENNREYLLTAATPAGRYQSQGPYDPADSYDFEGLSKYLDWIYVMAYDIGNGFSPVTNFNTPMQPVNSDPTPDEIKKWNNVSGAVEYYQKQGVPTDQLVLGTAFYGRSFEVSSEENQGLYQEYESTGPSPQWNEIKKDYLKDPDWKEYWHSTAEVPWLFNSDTNMFLAYDNPDSINKKAQFINKHNLRGGMIWHIGQDDNQNSLLNALSKPVLKINH